jgi:hypothetical protein
MEINTMITRMTARLGDSGIGSDHLLLPTVLAVQGGTLPTPRRVVIAGPAAVASNGEGVALPPLTPPAPRPMSTVPPPGAPSGPT